MLTEGSIRVRRGIGFMAAEFSRPAIACCIDLDPATRADIEHTRHFAPRLSGKNSPRHVFPEILRIGFAIHTGLLPASKVNHDSSAWESPPDSAFRHPRKWTPYTGAHAIIGLQNCGALGDTESSQPTNTCPLTCLLRRGILGWSDLAFPSSEG